MDNNNKSVYAVGARQGLWAGVWFSAIFLLQTMFNTSLFALLCANLMALAVPIILYSLLRNRYRAGGCEASFSEVWMHGIMIFICGSVIMALVSYVFLRFVDPDFLYRETGKLVEMYRSLDNATTSQIADTLEEMRAQKLLPSAIQSAFSFLWIGGFTGSILSLIEAALVKAFTRRRL